MSQAYQRSQLDDESKQYTTINTHKGLFPYTRLLYGISSAPGIFQRNMENLLQNIPYVIVRVDDILVSGASDEDHLNNLEEQVCVHGTSSYLPGSQGQQGRNSTVRRQGRSHHQCTSAEECVGAQIVLRHDQLLPEISA